MGERHKEKEGGRERDRGRERKREKRGGRKKKNMNFMHTFPAPMTPLIALLVRDRRLRLGKFVREAVVLSLLLLHLLLHGLDLLLVLLVGRNN